jgi:hypothetical protein
MMKGLIQQQHQQQQHLKSKRLLSGAHTSGHQGNGQQRKRFSEEFGGSSDGSRHRMTPLLAVNEPSPSAVIYNSRTVPTNDNKASTSVAVVTFTAVAPTELDLLPTQTNCVERDEQGNKQLSPNVVGVLKLDEI